MSGQSKQEENVQTDAELIEGLHYIGIISYLVYKNYPGDKKEIRDFLETRIRGNRRNAVLAETVK